MISTSNSHKIILTIPNFETSSTKCSEIGVFWLKDSAVQTKMEKIMRLVADYYVNEQNA